MSDLQLQVGGKLYSGWESVRIKRGIEQIAGTFELTVSDRWSGQDTPWPITGGDPCKVLLHGEPVITGFVDDDNPSLSTDSHSISVSGRDITGDLVDCSAMHTGEWNNRNLLQIAVDICKPHGITVTADTDIGAPFKKFARQPGETGFEPLARAAKMRGVLLVSNGLGGLLITRSSNKRIGTALVQGKNIKSASVARSRRDRFSHYIVLGSQPGGDWSSPEQNAQPKAEAFDKGVKRYRPLVIIAEGAADSTALEERAKWEAAVRFGKSERVTVTVAGWQHKAGIWQPNRLVPVDIPWLRLKAELLITAVTSVLDGEGSSSELELIRPEAYKLMPLPEPQEGDAW